MHILKKLGMVSLSAMLALNVSAYAVDNMDPEGGKMTQDIAPVSTYADESGGTAVAAVAATSADPEATAKTVAAAPAPAPAIKKMSVTRDAIKLDGMTVQPAGYNINDENYFKLRDIAYILNSKKHSFNVGYDNKTNSIALTLGTAYVPVGGELAASVANPKAQPSTAQVLIGGKSVVMTSYNIGGNNYFRLRDIGAHIGFGVDYVDHVITLTSGSAVSYNVSFDLNGHGDQLTPVSAGEGSKLTAPTAPTTSGFTFVGWYQDAACTSAWDFAVNTVKADTTLYAKWEKTYTLSFDMNGKGAQVDAQSGLRAGSKATMPAAPSAASYVFSGWYKDSGCKTAWDFKNDTVTADTTLYAKWSPTYTMTFHMNGLGAQVMAQTGLAEGTLAKEPPKPSAAGYTFGGWFIDQACNTPWIFSKDAVGQDVVVYARWTDNSTGSVVVPPADGEEILPPTTTKPTTPDNSSAIDGKITILIDPGHGGTDPGTSGYGLNENNLNLAIAQPLRDMLESAGATVIMTRDDTTTTLKGTNRKSYVESICAQGNIDFVVSIHHNAANTKASGAEIFVQTATVDPQRLSKQFGQLLMEEYQKIGQTSRGVKDSSSLYMVYTSAAYGVPAVLSEFCFLDNAADAAKIDSVEEQRAEAQAIYNALMAFFATHPY